MPWRDVAAIAILLLLGVVLFRDHIFGNGLYMGNPDRLNSQLKILKFHLDGLAQGHLNAWSDYEMLGYDTFTMPYTFPNIFTFVAYLAGPSSLYIVAGYEAAMLLGLAGAAAYLFLRISIKNSFAAAIGAILYEFSSLTILKVSQNDLSFAVFIIIPLLLLVIHQANVQSSQRSFLLLALLMFLLLHFTFLQKASYALILAGSYAIYRSFTGRNWGVLRVFIAAFVVGFVGAVPRIYGIALAMKEYERVVKGLSFENFSDVFRFQHIVPIQVLRWFDVTIFGRYPSEANLVLGNNINLTEGFLLYTSSLVPFLILFCLVRHRLALGAIRSGRDERHFFFWFMVFTFSVVAVPQVLHLIWLLYLRMDFTHARILIVGLLPLSMLVALILADLAPLKRPERRTTAKLFLIAIPASILIVTAIEFAATWRGSTLVVLSKEPMHVLNGSLARIAVSAAMVAALLFGLRISLRRPKLALVLYWSLGLAIGLQTFIGADYQINGSHTHQGVPFLNGNIYYATKQDFHPPTPEAIAALEDRLDNRDYRAVLLCDAVVAGGFCAGHIPEFWHLRTVDGYYGLGVPKRLGALPWHLGPGLRTISYTNPDHFDWPVLSLLNVKYAVKVDQALYRNRGSGPNEAWRAPSIDDVQIINNPLPVVPRYFFPASVVPVTSAEEAGKKLYNGSGQLVDVTRTSFVEKFSGNAEYSVGGRIRASGSGDHVRITVDPAPGDRFFVANELFFPGWAAYTDGKPVPIYATNAVMRGIVVPAGATTIEFEYTPFVRRRAALAFYGAALLLLISGAVAFGRPSVPV